MLNRRLSVFWRLCWSIVTPGIILIIFLYTIVDLQKLKYNNSFYPESAYGESLAAADVPKESRSLNTFFLNTVIGWILFSIAVLQIPLWMAIALFKKWHLPPREVSANRIFILHCNYL